MSEGDVLYCDCGTDFIHRASSNDCPMCGALVRVVLEKHRGSMKVGFVGYGDGDEHKRQALRAVLGRRYRSDHGHIEIAWDADGAFRVLKASKPAADPHPEDQKDVPAWTVTIVPEVEQIIREFMAGYRPPQA